MNISLSDNFLPTCCAYTNASVEQFNEERKLYKCNTVLRVYQNCETVYFNYVAEFLSIHILHCIGCIKLDRTASDIQYGLHIAIIMKIPLQDRYFVLQFVLQTVFVYIHSIYCPRAYPYIYTTSSHHIYHYIT